MFTDHQYPITIIGGGMVGLLFAWLLKSAQIPIVVVEAQAPLLQETANLWDARVSAINAASQQLLENVGIWQLLRPTTFSSLQKLKVWDSLGGAAINFDSAMVGVPALGAIVENREIIRVLWQQLQAHEPITLLTQVRPQQLTRKNNDIEIMLDNHQKIQTQLVVGADGGKSWVRQQMRSEIVERSYEQSAVITVVKTQLPHQQTGWQAFLPAAVLALLPLRDPYHCAVVWSVSTARAHQLISLTADQFNDELNAAFGVRLGDMKCQQEPQAIPLVMRHAKRYVESCLALIGDAAHTIHPLAGQGVNLGFMDAACLAQCIIDAHQQARDIGSQRKNTVGKIFDERHTA